MTRNRTKDPAATVPPVAAAPPPFPPCGDEGKPGSVLPPVAEPGTKASRDPGSPTPRDHGARASSRATPRTQAPRDGTREEAPSSPAGRVPDPRGDGRVPAGSSAIAAAMSENRGPDSLDARVRKLCDDLGLLRYHTHDARRSPAGFPDLVICGPGGVLYRELKRQDGKVTPEQKKWLDALVRAGADACVWRPSHLLNESIARELAAISYLSPVVRRARTAHSGGA